MIGVFSLQPRYNLRDLRVLNLPDCDTRITIALVAIARGIKRDQLRVLMHQYDFRFTNEEYTKWRQVVFNVSRLSDEAKTWDIAPFSDQTDETMNALGELKASNVTREAARLFYGLVFSNEDWTDA